jgi:hypothetical protein
MEDQDLVPEVFLILQGVPDPSLIKQLEIAPGLR